MWDVVVRCKVSAWRVLFFLRFRQVLGVEGCINLRNRLSQRVTTWFFQPNPHATLAKSAKFAGSSPWRVRSCTNCSSAVYFFTSLHARGSPWDPGATICDSCVTPRAIQPTLGIPMTDLWRCLIDFWSIKKTWFSGIAPEERKKQTLPMSAKASKK